MAVLFFCDACNREPAGPSLAPPAIAPEPAMIDLTQLAAAIESRGAKQALSASAKQLLQHPTRLSRSAQLPYHMQRS